jgi:hypothetical protein
MNKRFSQPKISFYCKSNRNNPDKSNSEIIIIRKNNNNSYYDDDEFHIDHLLEREYASHEGASKNDNSNDDAVIDNDGGLINYDFALNNNNSNDFEISNLILGLSILH